MKGLLTKFYIEIRLRIVEVEKLSFDSEEEMYSVIADFFKRQFPQYKPVVNKITFDLLKGWKIDVAAICQEKNNHVVSVEAKNDVSPKSILQGISQAEMYQKASNEAFCRIAVV